MRVERPDLRQCPDNRRGAELDGREPHGARLTDGLTAHPDRVAHGGRVLSGQQDGVGQGGTGQRKADGPAHHGPPRSGTACGRRRSASAAGPVSSPCWPCCGSARRRSPSWPPPWPTIPATLPTGCAGSPRRRSRSMRTTSRCWRRSSPTSRCWPGTKDAMRTRGIGPHRVNLSVAAYLREEIELVGSTGRRRLRRGGAAGRGVYAACVPGPQGLVRAAAIRGCREVVRTYGRCGSSL